MDIKKEKPQRRLLGKRNLLIAAGLAVSAAVVVGVLNLGKALPGVQRSGLWLEPATTGDMVREIRVSGILVPQDIRWVTAGAAANVQDVLIHPGANVQADTIIIRLVNPNVTANLTKAKAAMAGAQADLTSKRSALISQRLDQKAAVASGEASFQISRVRAKAMNEAYTMGAVAKIDFDQSQITLEQNQNLLHTAKLRQTSFEANIAAQLSAAKAQLDQVRSALLIAQQEADALSVRAGIDGILQQVSVEPGQQVAAGANLARVAKPSPLLARLQVPEIQAKDLRAQLPVRVDTHNGVVDGRIARIDPAVKNGSVIVDVTFRDNLPGGARPDLSVDGRIVLNTLLNVVSIARPALATPNATGTLFVLDPEGEIAQRRQVIFGAASSDRIQVIKGVAPREQVILSDMSKWNDYEALQLK